MLAPCLLVLLLASMKAPPKRKGNSGAGAMFAGAAVGLNESPSEKEGKYLAHLMHEV